MEDQIYWIWFQLVFGMGTRRAELFDRYFTSPVQLWEDIREGGAAAGMLTPQEQKASAKALEKAVVIYQRTLGKGCQVVTPDSASYPQALLHIYAKPAVLYVKGDLACLGALSIAMVGTRKHTAYGSRAAGELASGLAEKGVTIVSGLARGIDTVCHKAALEAGGKTVGIMGCGLDVDYPTGSSGLKTAMVKNGAVVSEFPLGTQPRPANFPIRNRIISGMSRGVVVVEADVHSGSLITANHALEQGRDVFAVPGDIGSPYMQGTHKLIKDGAKLAGSAGDILEEYGLCQGENSRQAQYNPGLQGTTIMEESPEQKQDINPSPPPGLSREGAEIYALLSVRPVTVEELAARSGLEIPGLQTALTELELYGLAMSLPGRAFVVSK